MRILERMLRGHRCTRLSGDQAVARSRALEDWPAALGRQFETPGGGFTTSGDGAPIGPAPIRRLREGEGPGRPCARARGHRAAKYCRRGCDVRQDAQAPSAGVYTSCMNTPARRGHRRGQWPSSAVLAAAPAFDRTARSLRLELDEKPTITSLRTRRALVLDGIAVNAAEERSIPGCA